MQSTEVGQPFHRDGWVYEEKYDGWCMVDYKDGTHFQLVSRAAKDHARQLVEAWRLDYNAVRPPAPSATCPPWSSSSALVTGHRAPILTS